jgi:hypothetical protein
MNPGGLPSPVSLRLVLLVPLAMPALGGCAATGPAIGTFPGCPVPVLISKVNRVGRKEPAPSQPAGLFAHFAARATWEKNAHSWQTDRYAYTLETIDSANNVVDVHDYYRVVTHVITAERSTEPNRLTWFVHDLVPTSADVKASDIQLDELRVTTDFTVVGLPAAAATDTEEPRGPNNGPDQTGHAAANGSLQTIVQVRGHKVWVMP